MLSDSKWISERLEIVPGMWRNRVAKIHAARMSAAELIQPGTGEKSAAQATANLWLVNITERMQGVRIPISHSDSDLVKMSAKCAADVFALANVYVTLPELREAAGRICQRYGIAPHEKIHVTKKGKLAGIEDGPAVARMTDPLWWRRMLRKHQGRAIEREAIALGYVHKRAEIYASDMTVRRRAQQIARNRAALENTEAVNRDTGEVFNLLELAARSVANPRIRRGELMARIAGFEAVAKIEGHAAEFVTLTTPSKYHPKKTDGAGRVVDNTKYTGKTPRDGQQYLGKVWARIRAKLQRDKVALYGFRIAEPHHDGTPHWHIIIFTEKNHVQPLRQTITRYALAEDAEEHGAAANRVKFVTIDPKRGSAAGYVAKYISKNIEGGGYEVQGDIEGHDAIFPAQRVEAWAAAWGIRQFQQVGGPPVGVWRELRRTAEEKQHTDTVAKARSAADSGNWGAYVYAMGGAFAKRKDQSISIAKTREGERWNFSEQCPEPAPLTRYGETARGAVFGVRDNTTKRGRVFQSRRYRWEVLAGKTAQPLALPWTRVNNCTKGAENDGNPADSTGASIGGGCAWGVGKSPGTDTDASRAICGPNSGGAGSTGGRDNERGREKWALN